MKNVFTAFLSALAVSTACAQTIVLDARTEQRLLVAHRAADEALQAFRAHPNGTTHAQADLAHCNFQERRDAALARGFVVTAINEQVEALNRSRKSLNLPAMRCAPSRSILTL